MTDAGDRVPAVGPAPATSTDGPAAAPAKALDDPAPDDRAARRAALRDLAAMIGAEVFY